HPAALHTPGPPSRALRAIRARLDPNGPRAAPGRQRHSRRGFSRAASRIIEARTVRDAAPLQNATTREGRKGPPLQVAERLTSGGAVRSALASALFEQPQPGDLNSLVYGLAHIVDGERGYGGGGQSFHLDPRRSGGADGGANLDAGPRKRRLHFDVSQKQRVTQRNQFRRALGPSDAGDARDFKRVALGILLHRP